MVTAREDVGGRESHLIEELAMATKKTDSTEGVQGGAAAKKTGSPSKTASAQKSAPAKGASAAPKSAQKSAPVKRAGGGTTGESGRGARAKTASRGGPDLRADARGFVSGRPQGWNHDEWLGFLEDLRQRGHNVEDRDAIGSLLERERLGVMLEKVPGIGAQRVRSIADHYGNVWRLKDASADELSRDAKIPRPLAERILDSVR
jgi:hypothetical protein